MGLFGRKKRILIIEDDAHLRRALSDKLEDEGYEVITANDGYHGLVKAVNEAPDLVLLDILLPRMDGMAFLDALRYDERGKKTRVVILSNLDDNKSRRSEAEKYHVLEYLVKSDVKIEEIVEHLKKYV